MIQSPVEHSSLHPLWLLSGSEQNEDFSVSITDTYGKLTQYPYSTLEDYVIDCSERVQMQSDPLTELEYREIANLTGKFLIHEDPRINSLASQVLARIAPCMRQDSSFYDFLNSSLLGNSRELDQRIQELVTGMLSEKALIDYASYHLGELSSLQMALEPESEVNSLESLRQIYKANKSQKVFALGVLNVLQLSAYKALFMKKIPSLARSFSSDSQETRDFLSSCIGLRKKWLDKKLFSYTQRAQNSRSNPLTEQEMTIFGKKLVTLFLKKNPFAIRLANEVFKEALPAFNDNPLLCSAFHDALKKNQEKLNKRINALKTSFLSERSFFSFTYQHLGVLLAFSILNTSGNTMHEMLHPVFDMERKQRFSALTRSSALAVFHSNYGTNSILQTIQEGVSRLDQEDSHASLGCALRILTLDNSPNAPGNSLFNHLITQFGTVGISTQTIRKWFNETGRCFSPEKAKGPSSSDSLQGLSSTPPRPREYSIPPPLSIITT